MSTTKVYIFLAKCYDEESGGFYEDTLRRGNPKMESTGRAVTMLNKAGVLNEMPIEIKDKIIRFLQSNQSADTGFFEDSQEKRDGETTTGKSTRLFFGCTQES